MLGTIDLTAIDPRVLQLPARPPRRAVLPVRGRIPDARELMQGMGAGGANPYPIGQCTWGVWQLLHDEHGVSMPDFPGNATDWLEGARREGYQVLSSATEHSVCVWSSSRYPTFGHVAYVTAIGPGPDEFTVKEMNFQAWNTWDTRVVRKGEDQEGIEGWFLAKGVEPGQSSGITTLGIGSDPWSELTGGIGQLQEAIQRDVTSLATKVFAGSTIVLGMGILGGGALVTALALQGRSSAVQDAVLAFGGRAKGFTTKTAVPAAQDVVLGPQPAVAGGTTPGRVTAAGRTRVLAR